MKKLLIILLSVLSLTAVAQEAKKVAILETVDKVGDVPYGIKLQVRMSLTYAISNTPGYEGYDRVDMASIMGEQNFQRTGMVSDAQIKKLGEMIGAQYVLIAEAALYDEQNIIITAKVLDVETGGVANSAPPAFANKDPEKMQAACVTLAQKLLGKSSFSSRSSYSSYNNTPSYNSSSNQDFTEEAWGINMKMIWVEGGEFMMGCTSEQSDCMDDEQNVRRVKLEGYYIGMLEVTQEQWEKVMGKTIQEVYQSNIADLMEIDDETGDTLSVSPFWSGQDLNYIGSSYPMYDIYQSDAIEFCRKLSNETGRKYTLPTEAQWEYAARGGKKSKQTKYAGSNNIQEVAWYNDNSACHNFEHCVKQGGMKKPNELGIYDMSGNVSEWCSDIYSSSYLNYDTDNPKGPKETDDISDGNIWNVYRGGSYLSGASVCRTSARDGSMIFDESIGFRVVCIPFADLNIEKRKGNTLSNRKIPDGYVDLGLPSSTLWKRNNEVCGLIPFDEARTLYGNKMPSLEQWEELKNECVWTWTGEGYKVIATNGNYIFLPAEGSSNDCQGNIIEEGIVGSYWLSSETGAGWKNHAFRQSFDSEDMYPISLVFRCQKGSVHLVY